MFPGCAEYDPFAVTLGGRRGSRAAGRRARGGKGKRPRRGSLPPAKRARHAGVPSRAGGSRASPPSPPAAARPSEASGSGGLASDAFDAFDAFEHVVGDPGARADVPLAGVFAAVWARLSSARADLAREVLPAQLHAQYARAGGVGGDRGLAGDERFAAVLRTLDEFTGVNGRPVERSPTQRMLHRHMVNAAARVIYSNDFEAARQRILERNRWERFMMEVLVVMPRGDGKTWSTAMFIAALLINCPGITITTFGVVFRAAKNVIRIVTQMVLSHPRGRAMVRFPTSAEKLTLRGPAGALDERWAQALPNNPNGTRGDHAQVVVCDEMAYMGEDIIMGTVLPPMLKGETALVGLTTLKDRQGDNIFEELINAVDTSVSPPVPLFNVVRTGRVCPACLPDPDKALACDHMRGAIPPWKSESRGRRLDVLYESRPDLKLRELKGIAADGEQRAFPSIDVEGLCTNVARGIDHVKCVYVAVDPSGGGASELAVVAVVEETSSRLSVCLVGTVVRCGNIDDHKTFILEVMARLRARFPACVVVFIPESNLGNEAAHLERYVTNDSAVFTLREGGQGRFGVCKTETSTLEMYSTTRTLLAARNLFVDEACIGMPTRDECVRKRMAGGSAAARTFMLDKLRRQLHQYRWEDKNAATAANSTRDRVFRLTGKRSRQNDDLTIALSMALHYRRVFWANVTNPVYHAAKVAMGVLRHGSGAPMPLYRAPAGASQADAYAAVLGRT